MLNVECREEAEIYPRPSRRELIILSCSSQGPVKTQTSTPPQPQSNTHSPSYCPMICFSSSLLKPGLESTSWPRALNCSAQTLSVASLKRILASRACSGVWWVGLACACECASLCSHSHGARLLPFAMSEGHTPAGAVATRLKSALHFSSPPACLPYLAVGDVAARHEGPRLARSPEARDGAGQHPVHWEARVGAGNESSGKP